jgi:hypothetical protein
MAPWVNTEKMSGGPNEKVVLERLNTESKYTGFVFHPRRRPLVPRSNDDPGKEPP